MLHGGVHQILQALSADFQKQGLGKKAVTTMQYMLPVVTLVLPAVPNVRH